VEFLAPVEPVEDILVDIQVEEDIGECVSMSEKDKLASVVPHMDRLVEGSSTPVSFDCLCLFRLFH
jgi:hypothetical protein